MASEIGTSMLSRRALERGERRPEKGLSRVSHGRESDQRRDPAEGDRQRRVHVARFPRPYRDRDQHDVHGGEPGHRHAPQQILLPRVVACRSCRFDRRRGEARVLQRGDEVGGACPRLVVDDADAVSPTGRRAPSLRPEPSTRHARPSADSRRNACSRWRASAWRHLRERSLRARGKTNRWALRGHGVSATKRRCLRR